MNPSVARLILASSSPRRRQLITRLGIPTTLMTPNADEAIDQEIAPVDQVVSLARRKAESVTRQPDEIVLGADTIVVHEGDVLIKPVDRADAERMLRRLRGGDHLVHSGLAVMAAGKVLTAVVTSTVRMRPFPDRELAAYLATGESMDKAGAYGIQGAAGRIVESVGGCYTNVVGLPLCATARLLIETGIPVTGDAPICALESEGRCPSWPAAGS